MLLSSIYLCTFIPIFLVIVSAFVSCSALVRHLRDSFFVHQRLTDAQQACALQRGYVRVPRLAAVPGSSVVVQCAVCLLLHFAGLEGEEVVQRAADPDPQKLVQGPERPLMRRPLVSVISACFLHKQAKTSTHINALRKPSGLRCLHSCTGSATQC